MEQKTYKVQHKIQHRKNHINFSHSERMQITINTQKQ